MEDIHRLYVGYPTALELWDAYQLRIIGMQTIELVSPTLQGCSSTAAAYKASALADTNLQNVMQKPIAIVVAKKGDRKNCKDLSVQIWSHNIPHGAFRLLDPTTAIATPAFCFVLAATRLSLIDLMQLGLEICGTYSSGYDSMQEFSDMPPKTSSASIRTLIKEIAADKPNGYFNAQRASLYLIDRIASPMEGVVYLLLCLPYRLGGYGLAAPQANMRIEIPYDLRKYTSSAYVYPDLCWPDAKVCLEYDSDEHHSGGIKSAQDSARRDVLSAMGYQVHTLNKAQVDHYQLFDATARMIASELGKRLRDTPDRPNYCAIMNQRQRLRRTLLNRRRDWKHELKGKGQEI